MANNPFKMDVSSDKIDQMLKTLRASGSSNIDASMQLFGKRIGVKLEEMIPEYPTRGKTPRRLLYTRTNKQGESYQSAFKNMEQQRFVFWAIGQHKIPYKRAGTLGQSLNSQVVSDGDKLIISIGTNRVSAPFVIDDEQQADIHNDVWWTLGDSYTKRSDEILQFAEKELSYIIGGNS